MRGVGTRGRWIALCSLLLGCAPQRPAAPPFFGHDVTLYVALTPLAEKSDSGNVAAMVDAIDADLREAGYNVTIEAARRNEAPPAVRLEVQVMSSVSGDASARGAGRLFGLGVAPINLVAPVVAVSPAAFTENGAMVVDAYVVRGGAVPPLYLGRFNASSVSFSPDSEEPILAGKRTGHAVAHTVLRGDLPAADRPLRAENMTCNGGNVCP
jgi:hypothetical protein